MSTQSASMRALAQRLLAGQVTNGAGSGADGQAVVQVCERLRISLTEFVGADGFTALLRRALALAQADAPLLQQAKLTPSGRLEGFQGVASNADVDGEAAIAITAHLLGLLVTFVGESLTLRLLRETFADTPDRMIVKPEDSE